MFSKASVLSIVLVFIFTVSYGMGAYAIFKPYFIETPQVLGGRITFGLFESCVSTATTISCQTFPSKSCHDNNQFGGTNNGVNWTLCQTFLVSRWLAIASVGFGGVAWFGSLVMTIDAFRKSTFTLTLSTLFFHALLQALVYILMMERRHDPIFNLGADFGVSMPLLVASFILDSIVFLFMGLVHYLFAPTSYAYIPIP